jgi:hypothetical protein
MKHIIDRHCLEAATLTLEAECTQILCSKNRRDRSHRDAIFNPGKAAAEFVEELSSLGVFTSEDGPSFRGAREEEDGEKERKVREAAEGFVERLVSQVGRPSVAISTPILVPLTVDEAGNRNSTCAFQKGILKQRGICERRVKTCRIFEFCWRWALSDFGGETGFEGIMEGRQRTQC